MFALGVPVLCACDGALHCELKAPTTRSTARIVSSINRKSAAGHSTRDPPQPPFRRGSLRDCFDAFAPFVARPPPSRAEDAWDKLGAWVAKVAMLHLHGVENQTSPFQHGTYFFYNRVSHTSDLRVSNEYPAPCLDGGPARGATVNFLRTRSAREVSTLKSNLTPLRQADKALVSLIGRLGGPGLHFRLK